MNSLGRLYLSTFQNLAIRLESQLVVMHLNNHYRIRNLILLRHFLRVRLLELNFEFLTYEHIPRESIELVDSLANYVLDLHISHLF